MTKRRDINHTRECDLCGYRLPLAYLREDEVCGELYLVCRADCTSAAVFRDRQMQAAEGGAK